MSKIIQLKDQEGDSLYPKTMVGTGIKVFSKYSQSIPKSSSYKIALDSVEYNTNNNLSLNNNRVVIGDGINVVLVVARWTAWSANTANRYIYIARNDENYTFALAAYTGTMESSAILPVKSGDTISMNCYSDNGPLALVEMPTATCLQVTVLG